VHQTWYNEGLVGTYYFHLHVETHSCPDLLAQFESELNWTQMFWSFFLPEKRE
jgi:hypothetical protein